MPASFSLSALSKCLLTTFVLLASPLFAQSDDDIPSVELSHWRVFLIEAHDYIDNGWSPLPEAENDLVAIRDRLEALGVSPDNIVEYSQRQGAKASSLPSKQNIEKGFQQYVEDLTEDDFAFVYLIGHGMENPDTNVSYFVPFDGELLDFGKSVSINGMLEQLGASSARLNLVVVDACRDGGTRGSDPVMRTKIAKTPKSVVLLQSCGPKEKSLESKELNHGFFTSKFLDALVLDDNPADLKGQGNKDGTLTVFELVQYAIQETKRAVKREFGKTQTPYVQGSITQFGILTNLKSGDKENEQRYEDLKTEAMKAFQRQDYDEALSKCDEMLKLAPEKQEEILAQRKIIENAANSVTTGIDPTTKQRLKKIQQETLDAFTGEDYDEALRKCDEALALELDSEQEAQVLAFKKRIKEAKAKTKAKAKSKEEEEDEDETVNQGKFALSNDELNPGDREKLTIKNTDFIFHYCPPERLRWEARSTKNGEAKPKRRTK